MSNGDINVDGRTDGRKIGRLYRTLLQAGAIIIFLSAAVVVDRFVCKIKMSSAAVVISTWRVNSFASRRHYFVFRHLDSAGVLDIYVTDSHRCSILDKTGIQINSLLTSPHRHTLWYSAGRISWQWGNGSYHSVWVKQVNYGGKPLQIIMYYTIL